MPAPAVIQSPEELREALLGLQLEHDALQAASAQAEHLLEALESLLVLGDEDDPFLRVFASLRKVFTFSAAMLLEGAAPDGLLECIVADPADLAGTRWPTGPTFDKAMAGRVVATLTTEGLDEWRAAAALGLAARQSALCVPVRVRDRRGILVLLRPVDAGGFDRGHVALARRFSVLVSHALATRYAHQSAAESQRLLELADQLRQSEQAARRSADLLAEVVNGLPVGLSVQDAQGRLLVVNDAAAEVMGECAGEVRGRLPFGLGGATAERAANRRLCFEQLLHSQAQRSREREVTLDERTRTLLITSKPLKVFDERLLLTVALDISERKRYERELSQRAYYDELTGLPNRALIQQAVSTALERRRRGGQFALAFIDLDNFKQVNDFYSHAVGDALLRAVAERICRSIRPDDMLARISGDEFLLLIDPLERAEDLQAVVNRVVEALKQPFRVEGHEVMTSASVGASIFPLHGDDYEALRRCADNAMYRAKRDRKGSVAYFEPSMGNALTARMDLEQRLRAAIRERRFRAAYQPKVDIAGGAVVGFEALIRWVEADGSVRMPGTFVELATELGLLDELTHFMLDDVIATLPSLTRRFGDAVTVSVNIGARQAADLDFMDSVVRRLEAGAIGPRIVLELTEDALVAAQRFQHHVLPRLRETGARVSIDDFGSGYSCLSMLSDVIADEVKIDRAFITRVQERPRSQGILRAIESLCNALQIDIVAEGVESTAELAYLRGHSTIRCAQGYLFSKPVFAEELLARPPGAEVQQAQPRPQAVAPDRDPFAPASAA